MPDKVKTGDLQMALPYIEGNLCDLPADCSVFHILTPAFIGSPLFPTSIIEN